jgi:hypothetical protein
MRMRKLALAAIILVLAASTHVVARASTHRHSGHVHQSGAKPANPSDARSTTSAAEPSDQRHPEDLELDRRIKSICRGC